MSVYEMNTSRSLKAGNGVNREWSVSVISVVITLRTCNAERIMSYDSRHKRESQCGWIQR